MEFKEVKNGPWNGSRWAAEENGYEMRVDKYNGKWYFYCAKRPVGKPGINSLHTGTTYDTKEAAFIAAEGWVKVQ